MQDTDTTTMLWAPLAWVDGRWRERVVLAMSHAGAGHGAHWTTIDCDQPAPPQATVLAGPALPGLVDAHSHAFQRAFVGMAEQRDHEHDDFWSWRDRMYRVALRIDVAQMRAVAAHLYAELLAGGYTQVCEFHYLHHAPDGTPYDDPADMAWALADAAHDAGIGLTLLPTLYERAGFTAPALRDDQRRFRTSANEVLQLQRRIEAAHRPRVNAGVAIHSLRAATPQSIDEIARGEVDGPVHIHVAEQTAEVDDCMAVSGKRPIEWLAHAVAMDRRWQLVHATHALPAEIDAVAACGAGVVLCPSTEANLGDGFCDLPRWLDAGVNLALGSDSHVVREWPEELRWLEYGQRLVHRRRNLSASPGTGQASTAARLFDKALHAGRAAAGIAHGGFEPGARADLLVIDRHDAALRGIDDHHLLDALVFAAPVRPFRDVMVAGHWRIRDHRHERGEQLAAAFADARRALG